MSAVDEVEKHAVNLWKAEKLAVLDTSSVGCLYNTKVGSFGQKSKTCKGAHENPCNRKRKAHPFPLKGKP